MIDLEKLHAEYGDLMIQAEILQSKIMESKQKIIAAMNNEKKAEVDNGKKT